MNHHTPTDHTPDSTPKEEGGHSAIRPDGSYEIVFSHNRSDTTYSADGYNAYGFSANGSKRTASQDKTAPIKPSRKEKKNTLPAVMLAVSIVLTVVSILISVSTFLMIRARDTHPHLGTKPNSTETVRPSENINVTIPTDIYAEATAKTVNSVVVISTAGGSGSGVVWASGESFSYIVTCHHVIDNEKEIKITFYNGKECYAELVGSDARTDIAVLRVNETGLSSILLPNKDTEMMLGQAVIAIGNPLGELGNSVSDGILSSLTRTITIEGSTMELLQTTAAVNHGTSGGGLFDLNGQLIGLVNAKISETSVEGIGFAIPVNTLKAVASELISQGFVSGRPSLGITTVMLDSRDTYTEAIKQYPDLEKYSTYRDFMGTKIVIGLYVIDPSTAAGYGENAIRLSFGDRLTAIGTTSITSASDVQIALNDYNAGDTVQITFVRENKTYVTEIVLDELTK